MNNIDNWNFPDPAPNVPLYEVPRVSTRAWTLVVRNRDKPLLKTELIRIVGAIEMLAGMEYHHDNFVRLCAPVPSSIDQAHLRHEAVAYLNRMGQFHKFAHSEFVATRMAPTVMTKFNQLLVFRNKYVAHRSIDVPRPGDDEVHQLSHARSLSQMFGSLFIPKDKSKIKEFSDFANRHDFQMDLWENNYLAFQIFDAKTNTHLNFCMQEDHTELMNEAYPVIENIVLYG